MSTIWLWVIKGVWYTSSIHKTFYFVSPTADNKILQLETAKFLLIKYYVYDICFTSVENWCLYIYKEHAFLSIECFIEDTNCSISASTIHPIGRRVQRYEGNLNYICIKVQKISGKSEKVYLFVWQFLQIQQIQTTKWIFMFHSISHPKMLTGQKDSECTIVSSKVP